MNDYNWEDIETRLKKLEISPLFRLSLASNELFHSNFIHWLLEHPNEQIATPAQALFCDFLGEKAGSISDPLREKKHNDLVMTLEYGHGRKSRKVIIENKVKSWRDLDQLGRYSDQEEKNEGQPLFVLLSMTAPPEAQDGKSFKDNQGGSWRYLSYKNLGVNFIKPLSKFAADVGDAYLVALLADYASMIENMSLLLERDLFHGSTGGGNIGEWSPAQIKVRSGDLQKSSKLNAIFEKILFERYQAMAYALLKVKNAGSTTQIYSGKEDKDIPPGSINIHSGYSSYGQTGYITFSYHCAVGNGIVIGVQVEGYQYRHFISHISKGVSVEDYVGSYFEPRLVGARVVPSHWNPGSTLTFDPPAMHSKYVEYCSFEEKHFLYLHTSIKNKAMSEIIQVAVGDILLQAEQAQYLTKQNTTLTLNKERNR